MVVQVCFTHHDNRHKPNTRSGLMKNEDEERKRKQ